MSQTQHVVCLLIREMGAVRRRHQTIILSSVLSCSSGHASVKTEKHLQTLTQRLKT